MGLTAPSIYLDSCLAIYLVEENPFFAPNLEKVLEANSNAKFCISPLTEMECLIGPLLLRNELLIAKFEDWFETVEVVSIERKAFHATAQLRADFSSLKTPDALHLATDLYNHCDEFWTNDNRLNSIAPTIVKKII